MYVALTGFLLSLSYAVWLAHPPPHSSIRDFLKGSASGDKSERHHAALCLLYGLFKVGFSGLDAIEDKQLEGGETVAALWRNHVRKDTRHNLYSEAVRIAKVRQYVSSLHHQILISPKGET